MSEIISEPTIRELIAGLEKSIAAAQVMLDRLFDTVAVGATIYCGESIRWRLEPADLQPTGGWLLMRLAAPMLKAECRLADGHDGLHEWVSEDGETEIRWRVER